MKKAILPLFLIVSSILAAFPALALEEKEPYMVKTFDMKPGGNLQVNTSGGSITVSGTSENNATIEVFVHGQNGKTDKAEIAEKLKNYKIDLRKENNTLIAEAKQIENKVFGDNGVSISFKIKVPNKTASNLNTNGGSISISNLHGDSKIHTSGGSIAMKGFTGDLNAETSGGSISLADATGSLKVHTSGGSIKLTNIAGDVDAKTSGGSIHADIRDLGKYLTLETNGGSVSATIPKGKGLTLDMTGSSVHADLANFKGLQEKNKINGSVNGGGIPVKLRTNGGSAKLNYRS